MAKQTFTVGQVLTAAQLTNLQQTAMGGGAATTKTTNYVLVAADAGSTVAMTSTSATTITVNTGLFAAGDTVFIQNLGTGACTVTAGTATVATAGSLILPQNDAGILYFTATGAAIFYDYIQAGAVSPLTTKGDLYGFSTSDARIPIGANNTVLTADSTESLGLKWATPAAGGMTLISETVASAISSLSLSSIAGTYKELYLVWEGIVASASGSNFDIRLNNDSTGIYAYGVWGAATNNSGALVFDADAGATATSLVGASSRYATFGDDGDGSGLDKNSMGWLRISNYASASKFKHYMGNWWNYDNNGGNTGRNACVAQGVYKSTSAVTSIDIVRTAGSATFSNATDTSIRLYGLS
jgi:hypothetical protein